MTLSECEHWLANGRKGSSFTYWAGHLAADRERVELHDGKLVVRAMEPADSIAKLMWRAYEQGRVFLFQERDGKQFFYIAMKRRN